MIHPSSDHFARAMTFDGVANCPQDGHWLVPTDSDICTEIETIALVFGFVRSLRPKVVVETGCNVGCMSQAICAALAANGEGVLHTCDVEPKFVESARRRMPDSCFVYDCTGMELLEWHGKGADLFWIDSSEDSRLRELEWLEANGKAGAVVLAHDTTCYEGLRVMIEETFPQHVLLNGPRGLGIVRL